MNASEIRIGNLVFIINRRNLVHLPEPIAMKIWGINLFKVDVLMAELKIVHNNPHKVDINDIAPIPLTADALEAFGFENHDIYGHIRLMPLGKHLNVLLGADVRIMMKSGNGVMTIKSSLTYVHELQNLYFALTGDELQLSNKINQISNLTA